MLITHRLGAMVAALLMATPMAAAAPGFATLGQPDLASRTVGSRCPDANARFGFSANNGNPEHGPSGIAIDPNGRLFVTDFAGDRVLTWPNVDALTACRPAEAVIGAGQLDGPEAVAIDAASGAIFVADTLSHTVVGYRASGKTWRRFVTLGKTGVPGKGSNRFHFPRGLAFDADGRLFVADDANSRVQIFNPPFANGEAAAASITAGKSGGFNAPKAVAIVGHTLFVADYSNNRVLRFTGPFKSAKALETVTGTFKGLKNPVDLAVHPDGSLLVTDQGNQRIARFADAAFRTSTAKPTSIFDDNIGEEPLGVAADRKGRVYVADYRQYRVLIRKELMSTAPVAGKSSPAARKLLADLQARGERSRDRTAIGQQLISYLYGRKSNPKAWYGDWLQMKQQKLPLPEIMGAETSDLMTYPGFSPNQDALDELIRHGKAGHIVTLVWHPSVPVDGADFSKPTATANLKAMIKDNTAIGRKWQIQLDRAAAVLQKFEDAGVPVLFRPLHEQNGSFFWWGDDRSTGAAKRARQAAYVAVWRDMVTELTKRKGLDNLVFVFGTNQVNYDGVTAPLAYYPGAKWADVVSIDLYDEELDMAGDKRGLQHYSALVGTGKPFGISEFGQSFGDKGTGATGAAWDARTLARRIRDSYPRTAFATAWYSSREGKPPVNYVFALPDVSFARQLLADILIETQ